MWEHTSDFACYTTYVYYTMYILYHIIIYARVQLFFEAYQLYYVIPLRRGEFLSRRQNTWCCTGDTVSVAMHLHILRSRTTLAPHSPPPSHQTTWYRCTYVLPTICIRFLRNLIYFTADWWRNLTTETNQFETWKYYFAAPQTSSKLARPGSLSSHLRTRL